MNVLYVREETVIITVTVNRTDSNNRLVSSTVTCLNQSQSDVKCLLHPGEKIISFNGQYFTFDKTFS